MLEEGEGVKGRERVSATEAELRRPLQEKKMMELGAAEGEEAKATVAMASPFHALCRRLSVLFLDGRGWGSKLLCTPAATALSDDELRRRPTPRARYGFSAWLVKSLPHNILLLFHKKLRKSQANLYEMLLFVPVLQRTFCSFSSSIVNLFKFVRNTCSIKCPRETIKSMQR
jgi:hypothetical protein